MNKHTTREVFPYQGTPGSVTIRDPHTYSQDLVADPWGATANSVERLPTHQTLSTTNASVFRCTHGKGLPLGTRPSSANRSFFNSHQKKLQSGPPLLTDWPVPSAPVGVAACHCRLWTLRNQAEATLTLCWTCSQTFRI